MHDLLKDMGGEIVQQESPWHPGKRSRLWFYEDVLQILEENMGTDEIKGILLDHLPQGKEIVRWSGWAFQKMKSLRILIVKKASFSQGPKHLPNCLRVLDWRGYPSRSLPPDFHPKKLAIFNLADSFLILDKPFQNLECLTIMDLSDSKFLTEIPDFSGVPNLRKLYLDNCYNLIEVHDSIGFLGKLEELSAAGCTNLITIPHVMKLTSLRYLSFFGCSRLTRFPEILGIMENISFINLWQTALQELPCSMGNLVGLESLNIMECICLNQLPCSIFSLPRLREVEAEGCLGFKFANDLSTVSLSKIRLYLGSCNLSDAFIFTCLSGFPNVSFLDLSYNNFTILPECIKECVFLKTLLLQNCKHLQEISGLPPNAEEIDALNCTSLSFQSSDLLMSQLFVWARTMRLCCSKSYELFSM
ncbi:hypothetical protein L6164_006265 [Bauhinia variegata]|uniref:Uncharacterized protein n=1 Tax=Bauhinia variegata TaxID=167791 RepID=A0ACB9PTS4_BAUVA|nr:hypothetical protein L6164_006265 [Bauhinia variegata]